MRQGVPTAALKPAPEAPHEGHAPYALAAWQLTEARMLIQFGTSISHSMLLNFLSCKEKRIVSLSDRLRNTLTIRIVSLLSIGLENDPELEESSAL